MREKGGLSLKDGETNIIMKYYGNLEISTADLYTIIDEIEEDNNEALPWYLTILNVFGQPNQRKMKLCV